MQQVFRVQLLVDFHGGDPDLPAIPYWRYVMAEPEADALAIVELMLSTAMGWEGVLYPEHGDRADVEVSIEAVPAIPEGMGHEPLRYDAPRTRLGRLQLDLRLAMKAVRRLVEGIRAGTVTTKGMDGLEYATLRVGPLLSGIEALRPISLEVDFDVRVASASVHLDALIALIDADIGEGVLVLPAEDALSMRPRRNIDVVPIGEAARAGYRREQQLGQ